MIFHAIPKFAATLVVERPLDGGEVLVVVDADQPAARLLAMARVILPEHEHEELARFLA